LQDKSTTSFYYRSAKFYGVLALACIIDLKTWQHQMCMHKLTPESAK